MIDTPLAESSIVGIGIGLALAGMRPVAEIQFADFMHSTFDQMVSEAAKIHYRSNGDFSVPLVVRTPWGGGGHRGPYHSQAIEAFYAHVAGLKVVVPSTPADVAGLLRSAIEDPDPVLFLEHKKTYRKITGLVPDGQWRVPIGAGRRGPARRRHDARHLRPAPAPVAGGGRDPGRRGLLGRGHRPAHHLARWTPTTILASAVRTGRVLVVHEDNVSFGVGAEVAATVAQEAFYDLDAPVRRLAMPDVPAMPFEIGLERALSVDHGRHRRGRPRPARGVEPSLGPATAGSSSEPSSSSCWPSPWPPWWCSYPLPDTRAPGRRRRRRLGRAARLGRSPVAASRRSSGPARP